MRERKESRLGKITIVILLVNVLLSCQRETKTAETYLPNDTKEETAICEASNRTRPFPNIPTDYETFTVNPQKGIEWISEKGTIIRVPKNALVDENGNPIEGEVVFKLNEMRDMVDVFLSGVPMTYDSNGVVQHFESAGMFELRAELDGKPVFVNPKNPITVDFASENDVDKFNIYQYDKKQGRWDFKEKDGVVNPKGIEPLVRKAGIQLNVIESELDEEMKKIGVQPELAQEGELNFRVIYDEEVYPELAVSDGLMFQILNKDKFKPEYSAYEWSKVDITRGDNGNYAVHFNKPDMKVEYVCKPVFEGDNYDLALAEFEKRYQKSKKLIEGMEKRAAVRRAKFAKLEKLWNARRVQDSLRRSLAGQSYASKGKVMRQFQVLSFGFYNSDCPRNLPQGKRLLAELQDETQNHPDSLLNYQNIYLVDKDTNALYTIFNPNQLSFNPESENLLWTVTYQNKLAIYYPSGFESLAKVEDGSPVVLKMKVVDADFESEAQLREFLNI